MFHTFTDPRGHTQIHTHRKVSRKQLLGFKSSSVPPASLTRVGTLEQGSACRGRRVAEWSVFGGGLWRGRVYGKGKCSAGRFGYQWKGFLCATQGSRLAFLYLPLLIPPQRKGNVKETCTRNISRKGQSKQLQSNPWRGRCLKPSSETRCIKLKL